MLRYETLKIRTACDFSSLKINLAKKRLLNGADAKVSV